MVAGLLAFVVSTASAAPIFYGGHAYEIIEDTGITWDEANTAAVGMTYNGAPGHLATLTTAGENNFIRDNLGTGGVGYWLGGFQDPADEPGANVGWTWVTPPGDAWSWTNWDGNEPNDYVHDEELYPYEDKLMIYSNDNVPEIDAGIWNDLHGDRTTLRGYVVEYAAPEPATMGLLIIGGILNLLMRRRRRMIR